MSSNYLRRFFRICLTAVVSTVFALVQPASAQTTRPAAWSLAQAPDCTAYAPCSNSTDATAVCYAELAKTVQQRACVQFTGLSNFAIFDRGGGSGFCQANANYSADGSCWWYHDSYHDALGVRVFGWCEVLKSSTVAIPLPHRVGNLDYVCPVVTPPPPPPLPLGCAAGDGGFSQCPGDTGVGPSGPPGPPSPPPTGTPEGGGPGPNLGAPGNDSSTGTAEGTGGSCSKSAEAVGDPVFPATGNVYEEETDYAGPIGLSLIRRYNSALPGWVHNYSVRVLASPTVARVIRPDGRMHTFTGDVSGGWIAETTARERLIQLSPANASEPLWQYVTADDGSEWFDAQGRLVAVTRRGGQRYVVQQSEGLLRSVSDSFGHSLRFSYDGQRRLIQVTTPESTNVRYGYDVQGRLSQVTFADGSTRQYQYENSVYPLGLTAIVDERGVRFTSWTYDASGRAATSERAGAQRHQFQYNADRSARIVDPLGTVRTQSYSWVGSRALFARPNPAVLGLLWRRGRQDSGRCGHVDPEHRLHGRRHPVHERCTAQAANISDPGSWAAGSADSADAVASQSAFACSCD